MINLPVKRALRRHGFLVIRGPSVFAPGVGFARRPYVRSSYVLLGASRRSGESLRTIRVLHIAAPPYDVNKVLSREMKTLLENQPAGWYDLFRVRYLNGVQRNGLLLSESLRNIR